MAFLEPMWPRARTHPEIFNVYKQGRLTLTTHDAGNTVTEKDYRLAAAIDALLQG